MKHGEEHGRCRHSDETVESARALYDEGMAPREIGEKLEISEWTIWDWVLYRTRQRVSRRRAA